jgi:hypothetical protein
MKSKFEVKFEMKLKRKILGQNPRGKKEKPRTKSEED